MYFQDFMWNMKNSVGQKKKKKKISKIHKNIIVFYMTCALYFKSFEVI